MTSALFPNRTFSVRGFFLFFVIAFVVGCSSRPPEVLAMMSEPTANGHSISMLTVSTRGLSPDATKLFSGERGPAYQLNEIEVSIPPSHQRGVVEWPHEPHNPEREFGILSISDLDDEGAAAWFRKTNQTGRLFIFVHGYNVRFSDAVYRLAQITHDLQTGARPILFTWPSRGTLSSYIYDKESATYSRDSLERLLDRVDEIEEVEEVVVLAHSMGTWLTMEALRQSAIRNGAVSSKLSDVILASPDIDRDVFVQQFQALGPDRPHFTVLVSNDDQALRLSSILAGNIKRIGRIDTSAPQLADWLKSETNVTIVDLTELEAGGSQHHSKFANDDAALDLVASTVEGAVSEEASEEINDRPSRAVLVTLSQTLDD